ncbi:hypothetical protein BGZ65_011710 [Modicella reniformis]|uniref:Uncharacterized protein n=1 Tax=Modicella reniformis TaxID=1440133 RepID=A0A9P6J3T3_9FUNG|nr:hypothetical protein BGZ65_011710 [Modicella reniformis]
MLACGFLYCVCAFRRTLCYKQQGRIKAILVNRADPDVEKAKGTGGGGKSNNSGSSGGGGGIGTASSRGNINNSGNRRNRVVITITSPSLSTTTTNPIMTNNPDWGEDERRQRVQFDMDSSPTRWTGAAATFVGTSSSGDSTTIEESDIESYPLSSFSPSLTRFTGGYAQSRATTTIGATTARGLQKQQHEIGSSSEARAEPFAPSVPSSSQTRHINSTLGYGVASHAASPTSEAITTTAPAASTTASIPSFTFSTTRTALRPLPDPALYPRAAPGYMTYKSDTPSTLNPCLERTGLTSSSSHDLPFTQLEGSPSSSSCSSVPAAENYITSSHRACTNNNRNAMDGFVDNGAGVGSSSNRSHRNGLRRDDDCAKDCINNDNIIDNNNNNNNSHNGIDDEKQQPPSLATGFKAFWDTLNEHNVEQDPRHIGRYFKEHTRSYTHPVYAPTYDQNSVEDDAEEYEEVIEEWDEDVERDEVEQ